MAFSATQIANLGLSRIGVRQLIESLTDDESTEAQAANLLYEPMRDAVLSDAHWPFARRTVTLALVEEDPNSDWSFSYRRPTDCIRAIRINNSGRLDQSGLYPFEIGADDAGGLIFTDVEDPVLQYVSRIEDPSQFSVDFVMALSWRMAKELALTLAVAKDYAQNATREYERAIQLAKAMSFNEEKRDPREESEFITSRS